MLEVNRAVDIEYVRKWARVLGLADLFEVAFERAAKRSS